MSLNEELQVIAIKFFKISNLQHLKTKDVQLHGERTYGN